MNKFLTAIVFVLVGCGRVESSSAGSEQQEHGTSWTGQQIVADLPGAYAGRSQTSSGVSACQVTVNRSVGVLGSKLTVTIWGDEAAAAGSSFSTYTVAESALAGAQSAAEFRHDTEIAGGFFTAPATKILRVSYWDSVNGTLPQVLGVQITTNQETGMFEVPKQTTVTCWNVTKAL